MGYSMHLERQAIRRPCLSVFLKLFQFEEYDFFLGRRRRHFTIGSEAMAIWGSLENHMLVSGLQPSRRVPSSRQVQVLLRKAFMERNCEQKAQVSEVFNI